MALVGAGNSAGQAAVYLASHAKKVTLLARRGSLDATMSRYLVERIAAQPNIEVLTETEIEALEGHGGSLDKVRWRNHATGRETTRADPSCLFVHWRRPEHGLAGELRRGTRRQGLRAHRTGSDADDRPAGDKPSRRVCHRRRALAARSSGSRPPSAKEPRWWRRCMPILRRTAAAPLCLKRRGDRDG